MKRPKSLSAQASTWSDYKHHNTFRFLVGITPTGFISFLSSCYGGRASDKCFTRGGGFHDLFERDDKVIGGMTGVLKFKKICFFIFAG